MKKIYTNTMMALIATITIALTSCEDEKIARTLEGTWRGNMYISTDYRGRSYDAIYTEITFLKDPTTFSSGNGYWVDYYSDAPWDYVANHIDWTVNSGVIKVYFVEDDAWIRISDYRLSDDRFYGVLDDNGRRVDFELYHTSSPNWGNYHWGYDYWYDSYAPTLRTAASDSIAMEKPVRYVKGK